eukprot:12040_4
MCLASMYVSWSVLAYATRPRGLRASATRPRRDSYRRVNACQTHAHMHTLKQDIGERMAHRECLMGRGTVSEPNYDSITLGYRHTITLGALNRLNRPFTCWPHRIQVTNVGLCMWRARMWRSRRLPLSLHLAACLSLLLALLMPVSPEVALLMAVTLQPGLLCDQT